MMNFISSKYIKEDEIIRVGYIRNSDSILQMNLIDKEDRIILTQICENYCGTHLIDFEQMKLNSSIIKQMWQIRPVIICLLLFTVVGMKMRLTLRAEQQKCFYQMLMAQQKYALDVTPLNQGTYEVDIRHKQEDSWLHAVHRTAEKSIRNISLYKLASFECLYSFCLINTGADNLQLSVELRWGLQLLDLEVLASENDQQNLIKEAQWIDKQSEKIIQIINSAGVLRSKRRELSDMMGLKMVVLAVAGLVILVLISLYSYWRVKQSFRERKLI